MSNGSKNQETKAMSLDMQMTNHNKQTINPDQGNNMPDEQQINCDGMIMNQAGMDIMTCDVVRDLLPLYHDGAVSENTYEAVKKHLEACESCQKEYKVLCAEFPVEDICDSTKEEFDKVIKKQKRKQNIISSIIILIICTLFVVLFYVADRVPIVPVKSDEIQLEEVSRYWTKDGFRFAIPYDCMYNDSKPVVKVVTSEEGTGLDITFKRTLFAYKHENYSWQHQVWASNYDLSAYGGEGIDPEEIDFVKYDGEVIWDVEEDGDEPVPIAYTNEKRYRDAEGEINIKGQNSVRIEYFNASVFVLIFSVTAWGIPFFGLILSKKKRENILLPIVLSFMTMGITMILHIMCLYHDVLEGDFASVEDTIWARLVVSVILLLGTIVWNLVGYVLQERKNNI